MYGAPGCANMLLEYDFEADVVGGLDITSFGSGCHKWMGLIAHQGVLYGAPHHATQMLAYSPSTGTLRGVPTDTVAEGQAKWAAVGSMIYAAPYCADQILRFDVAADEISGISTATVATGGHKWFGFAQIGDQLLSAPVDAEQILSYNLTDGSVKGIPTTALSTGIHKWVGTVAHAGCIYAAPYYADCILKFCSASKIASCINTAAVALGERKWTAPTPIGKYLFFAPERAKDMLVYNTELGMISRDPVATGDHSKYCGTTVSVGDRVLAVPRDAQNILVYKTGVAAAPTTTTALDTTTTTTTATNTTTTSTTATTTTTTLDTTTTTTSGTTVNTSIMAVAIDEIAATSGVPLFLSTAASTTRVAFNSGSSINTRTDTGDEKNDNELVPFGTLGVAILVGCLCAGMMCSCAVYHGLKAIARSQHSDDNNQTLGMDTVIGHSHCTDKSVEVEMQKQIVGVGGGCHGPDDEVQWITLRRFRKLPLVRDNSGAWKEDGSDLSLYEWAARHVDCTGSQIRFKTAYGPLIKTQMQVAEPNAEAFLKKLLEQFNDMKREYRKKHSRSNEPCLKLDVDPIFEQEASASSSSGSTADQANEAQGEVPETLRAVPEDVDDISVWNAFIEQNIRKQNIGHTFIHFKIDTGEDVARPHTR